MFRSRIFKKGLIVNPKLEFTLLVWIVKRMYLKNLFQNLAIRISKLRFYIEFVIFIYIHIYEYIYIYIYIHI